MLTLDDEIDLDDGCRNFGRPCCLAERVAAAVLVLVGIAFIVMVFHHCHKLMLLLLLFLLSIVVLAVVVFVSCNYEEKSDWQPGSHYHGGSVEERKCLPGTSFGKLVVRWKVFCREERERKSGRKKEMEGTSRGLFHGGGHFE